MRRLLGWAVAPFALYLVMGALVFFMQRRILFVPDTGRPLVKAAGVSGLREVELRTDDGLALLAWWLPPGPGRPVVAYFHGNGGNLMNRIPRVRLVAEAGYGLLMPEYRGYGGNPGVPGEAAFVADARGAMDWLDAQGVGRGRQVIYGESIGTGVAAWLGSEREAGAVVLESPYTSVVELARARFWWLPVGWLVRDRFDTASRIGRVQAPVLVVQGGRDGVVPPGMGRAVFGAAGEPKELWTAAEAGHNDLMEHGAWGVVRGFVERHVGR